MSPVLSQNINIYMRSMHIFVSSVLSRIRQRLAFLYCNEEHATMAR